MWQCAECETEIEDELAVCWNCGTTKQGKRDPAFVKADDYLPPRADAGRRHFGLFSAVVATSVVVVILAIARISQSASVYLVAVLILLLSLPWFVYGLRRLL